MVYLIVVCVAYADLIHYAGACYRFSTRCKSCSLNALLGKMQACQMLASNHLQTLASNHLQTLASNDMLLSKWLVTACHMTSVLHIHRFCRFQYWPVVWLTSAESKCGLCITMSLLTFCATVTNGHTDCHWLNLWPQHADCGSSSAPGYTLNRHLTCTSCCRDKALKILCHKRILVESVANQASCTRTVAASMSGSAEVEQSRPSNTLLHIMDSAASD